MRARVAASMVVLGLVAVDLFGLGQMEPVLGEAPPSTDTGERRCLVRLHGKSGSGGETTIDATGVANIFPNGNAEGWGGRQWLYFPDAEYERARQVVVEAVANCDVVILNGFSNGASFAAKLYCRGESLDGRLISVVVDDPVPDAGVLECEPEPAIALALYWTGALESTAQPGWDCGAGDWTCEGGTTIGIDAYSTALDTDVIDSPLDGHEWYWDPPELSNWERQAETTSLPEDQPNSADSPDSTVTSR